MEKLIKSLGCITLACIILGIPMVFGMLVMSKEYCYAIFTFIGVAAEGIGLTYYFFDIEDRKK